jgi:hypothetical protein
MTFSSDKNKRLTDEEFNEMVALRNAIHDLPQSVSPEQMEKFTGYLVRSIRENGG